MSSNSAGEEPLSSPPSTLRTPKPTRPIPQRKAAGITDEEEVEERSANQSPSTKTRARPRRSTHRVSYIEQPPSDISEVEDVNFNDGVSDASAFSEAAAESEAESEDSIDTAPTDEGGSSPIDTDVALTDEDEPGTIAPIFLRPPKKIARTTATTTKSSASKYVDLSLPPLSNIEEIFQDMAHNALGLGLGEALRELKGRPINVATMCSGTESPLIALQLLSKALEKDGKGPILVKHHFSAEIDAMKQGFIERNFQPSILFRDVREFIPDDATTATTAYGAEVSIPGELDILIAGFVCKDLSRLNNRPKGLDEEGESGDTWNAIYSYTKKFKPSIVLIENVQNQISFWNSFKEKWAKIGYECSWLYRDTKNYYVPQTRIRMYMVAINKELYGKGAEKAVVQWEKIVTGLERKCSSPFESFLLNDTSDPFAYPARSSEVDWALCKLRYDRIRAEERLGTRRPVSRWSENGSVRPPDMANRRWYQSQSTRVYDAIDIAHLQAAKAGEDSLSKMVIWDVSQNVDRFKTSKGIAPCITPSGCDFVTNKQAALSGSQLLLLQGMPYEKLLFARETQKDRQDLAGNAMTTTVVGAAIIAALISGRKSFRKVTQHSLSEASRPTERSTTLVPTKMKETTILPPDLKALNLQELLNDSKLSSRLCSCEGTKHISNSPVQICGECHHTACSACAGNPRHMYGDTMVARDLRIRPAEFERKWRPRLPAHLQLGKFPNMSKLTPTASGKEWQAFKERMAEVDDSTFFIDKFQRLENKWRISYVSTEARLELHIHDHPEWRLYVKCPSSVPGNSHLRKTLAAPVARGTVANSSSLFQPNWEVFIPQTRNSSISITGSLERNSSWRSRLGLLDYKDETVPTTLEVKAEAGQDANAKDYVSGTYKLLPQCGTAMSSLYKRSSGTTQYFFLDPDPIGPGQSDPFVFAESHRQLPYGETRVIQAQLDPMWRPWSVAGGQTVKVTTASPGSWTPADLILSSNMPKIVASVPEACAVSTSSHGCSPGVRVLDVKVPMHLDVRELSSYIWALEQAKLKPQLAQWNSYGTGCPDPNCSCAPPLPRTVWNVEKNGQARAYEDRKAAALYERLVKTRPPIFDIRASALKETRIEIGLNVASLVHRARNRLARYPNCKTAWRLVTNHMDSAEPFEKFHLRSNVEDTPYTGPLHLDIPLVEAQQKSLTWMRNQELGATLTLTEVEEEVHLELAWRAEARVETDITIRGGVLADLPSFGKTVTTIGLVHSEFEQLDPASLVQHNSELGNPGLIEVAATLIVCPPHIAKQWRTEFATFLGAKAYREYNLVLIETFDQLRDLKVKDIQAACVIICSWRVFADERYIAQLAHVAAVPEPATSKGRAYDAWLDYIVEQLPERVRELESAGPGQFEDNDNILEARLDNPEFKGIVPLKPLHGSAYQSYNTMQSKQAGKGAEKQKRKVTSSVKKKRYDPTAEWTSYTCPVLQMFRFNRVVVDEYHYLFGSDKDNYPAYSAVKRMEAHKRWLLSGTPALGSFADVNQIASLLGATLGRDVFGLNPTKMEQRILDDQTDVEKFLSLTEVRTYEWHKTRHERAQEFLDRFVRQNEPCLAHIACSEVLRPVELDVAHHAVYLELSQHLIAQKMMVKKLKSSDKSDRTHRLHASLNNSSTAEEALIKSALQFETDEGSESESGLGLLLHKRQEQTDETKREILIVMTDAEGSQKGSKATDENYHSFKDSVKSGENVFGDRDAHNALRRLLRQAEKRATEKKSGSKKSATDWKKLTSNLGVLSKELTLRMRSLRFIQSIKDLLPAISDEEGAHTHKCSASNCQGSEISQLFLVSDCGHLACQSCLEARIDSESCVDKDCDVHVRGTNLVKVSSLVSGRHEATGKSFGAKLDAIAELILRLPKDDQAIVFVPNDETIGIMEDVLEHHDINFSSVTKRKAGSAKLIEDFKTNSKKKVLILNLEDESASGV
jgi:site-specific DNA-cytosine methylase